MTPPVVDPLHADAGAPPPPPSADAGAPPPPPEADPPVRRVTPEPETPPASDPAASAATARNAWDNLHLVIGGGYNFGNSFAPGSAVYRDVAPGYTGGDLFFQPSYSVFQGRIFDFRLGANLGLQFLSIPRRPGSVDSSVTGLAIDAMAEGNFNFHQHFGLGLNVALGYQGWMSSNADVGAPFTATFDFGSEGGFHLQGQGYLHTWNQAIRLGVGVSGVPSGFGLRTAPGQPDLLISPGPAVTLFLGIDPIRMIRNIQHGGGGSTP
ncbi:MAG: hypothetical protein IT573_00730 [Deltaproteobacteria bacterium]|nr:hypothetical protein [Deltaproteobacteria bacterium]